MCSPALYYSYVKKLFFEIDTQQQTIRREVTDPPLCGVLEFR